MEKLTAGPRERFETFARSVRDLEIALEINRRLVHDVRNRFPGDERLVASVSLVDWGH